MLQVPEKRTSVLIVGGSLVGLSAAVFLSHHGIHPILIERHAGSSPHPRALGFRSRTMEMYRSVGLMDKIPLARPDFKLERTRVHSLAGEWYEKTQWSEEKKSEKQSVEPKHQNPSAPSSAPAKPGVYDPVADYSFTVGADITQNELEDILREAAISNGADLRYSTELVRFEQDKDGVTAFVKQRIPDGAEYRIHADYLIAADGHRSLVREALGIQREGRGVMQTIRSVLFRAPALEEYRAKGPIQFNIDQPDLQAFMTYYKNERWALMFTDGIARDEAAYKEAIYKAVGRTDFDIEIVATGEWQATALIADSFQSGHIFLAGDSAHALPPNRGGYGANTGIADAWNLSWKLASVINGQSEPELLDTYDAERRPIALLRHDQIFCRQDYKAHAPETAATVEALDDIAVELGEIYYSKAVLPNQEDSTGCSSLAKRPDEWNGQPGTRAAHWWLTVADKPSSKSSIDFYGKDWVLITESEEWKEAVIQLHKDTASSSSSVIKIKCVQLGIDEIFSDLEGFKKIMGISSTGASLVRPDGVIAWRVVEMSKLGSGDEAPVDILRNVLTQIAFVKFRVLMSFNLGCSYGFLKILSFFDDIMLD